MRTARKLGNDCVRVCVEARCDVTHCDRVTNITTARNATHVDQRDSAHERKSSSARHRRARVFRIICGLVHHGVATRSALRDSARQF